MWSRRRFFFRPEGLRGSFDGALDHMTAESGFLTPGSAESIRERVKKSPAVKKGEIFHMNVRPITSPSIDLGQTDFR